jgi:hypothetical protein
MTILIRIIVIIIAIIITIIIHYDFQTSFHFKLTPNKLGLKAFLLFELW